MRFASRSKVSDSGKLKAQRPAKPPRGVTNDGEYAHLRSLNLLYDPGLELFMQNSVEHWGNDEWLARTGNNQYTLPIFDPTCEYGQRWPSGECVRYWDIAQWMQWGEPYDADGSIEKTAWIANRLDPYLGDFHLTWAKWDSTDPAGVGDPRPVMIQSPGLPPGYSARVEPGDIISWSVRTQLYGMRYWLAEAYCTMSLFFYTDTGAPVVGLTESTDLTTHVPGTEPGGPVDSFYEECRVDATAPSGSYFLRAIAQYHNPIRWGGDGVGGDTELFLPSVHIDSGVLSVW